MAAWRRSVAGFDPGNRSVSPLRPPLRPRTIAPSLNPGRRTTPFASATSSTVFEGSSFAQFARMSSSVLKPLKPTIAPEAGVISGTSRTVSVLPAVGADGLEVLSGSSKGFGRMAVAGLAAAFVSGIAGEGAGRAGESAAAGSEGAGRVASVPRETRLHAIQPARPTPTSAARNQCRVIGRRSYREAPIGTCDRAPLGK